MNSIQKISTNLDSFKKNFFRFLPNKSQLTVVFPHYLIDAAKKQSYARKNDQYIEPNQGHSSQAKHQNKGSSLMGSHADDTMKMMVTAHN
jgi:hypothetical protein